MTRRVDRNASGATPEERRDELARELANVAEARRGARRRAVSTAPAFDVGDWLFEIEPCLGGLDCWTGYADRAVKPREHWRGHLRRYRVIRLTAKRVYYRPRFAGPDRFTSREEMETVGRSSHGRAVYEGELHTVEPPAPHGFGQHLHLVAGEVA